MRTRKAKGSIVSFYILLYSYKITTINFISDTTTQRTKLLIVSTLRTGIQERCCVVETRSRIVSTQTDSALLSRSPTSNILELRAVA